MKGKNRREKKKTSEKSKEKEGKGKKRGNGKKKRKGKMAAQGKKLFIKALLVSGTVTYVSSYWSSRQYLSHY